MISIEIGTITTLEFDGEETEALICATVYPATNTLENEPSESMRIEIDNVDCFEHGYFEVFFERALGTENYNRCLLAVQNKINELL